MKTLLFIGMFLLTTMSYSQTSMVYNCDDFSAGQFTSVGNSFAGSGVFTITSPTPGEMQVACNVPANSYKMFQVYFPSPATVNVSGQLPVTVTMNVKATADVDIRVDLQDNTTYQATNQAYVIKTITAGSTFQAVDFIFDAAAFTGSTPNAVDQTKIATFVIYIAHNASSTYTGTVTFDYMSIGSSTTNVKGINSSIADAKLYPNPLINQNATVDITLNDVSDVKVIVSDITGRILSTIEEQNVVSFNKTLTTAQLKEGTYLVSYVINNDPVKTELLIIR